MGQGHPSWPDPPLTQTTLGQLCTASLVSRLRLGEPGSVVMQYLKRCATREAHRLGCYFLLLLNGHSSGLLKGLPQFLIWPCFS